MAKGNLAQLLKAKRGGKKAAPQEPSRKPTATPKRSNTSIAASAPKRGKHSQHGGGAGGGQHDGAKARAARLALDDATFELPKVEEGADAYNALMGLFSSRGGQHSQALRQLQLEREGESDEEDSDNDSMSEEGSMEGSEGEGDLDGASEDDDASGDEDGVRMTRQGKVKGSWGSHLKSKPELRNSIKGPEGQKVTKGKGKETPVHASLSPAELAVLQEKLDHWQSHLHKELTDSVVSELQEGKATKFTAAPEHPDFKDAWTSGQWQVDGRRTLLPDAPSPLLAAYAVKPRLHTRWTEVHKNDRGEGEEADKSDGPPAFVSDQQRTFFAMLNSYADIFLPARSYPADIFLPAMFYFKASDRIKKNNDKLAAAEELKGGSAPSEDIPRDQGFTRPKILLLLPQRNLAFKAIMRLVALAMKETRADTVQGKEKFVDQFTDPQADPEDENDEKHQARRAAKPMEWRALFDGNTDDHFRMGIKITRGAISIEILVVDRADVMTMQNWSHVDGVLQQMNQLPKEQHGTDIMRVREGVLSGHASHYRQTILLSSFQSADMNALFSRQCTNYQGRCSNCLSASTAAARQMQQMMLLNPKLFDPNLRPSALRVQQMFERFRSSSPTDTADACFLHFNSKSTLLVQKMFECFPSSSPTDTADARFLHFNPKSTLQVQQMFERFPSSSLTDAADAHFLHFNQHVQQMFERFPSSSPTDAADARFLHFKQRVWPRLKESLSYGLLIFLPNYFDFVRVRNFMKAEDADYTAISEYTEPPDVTAARSRFFNRKRRILLYTERTHFYHRHRIRGIKDILMYSLPEHGNYYSEIVNLLEDASSSQGGLDLDGMPQHATVSAMFSRFDTLQLSRVVGKERSKRMLSGDNSTFMFC
eukprot:gene9960-7836_t